MMLPSESGHCGRVRHCTVLSEEKCHCTAGTAREARVLNNTSTKLSEGRQFLRQRHEKIRVHASISCCVRTPHHVGTARKPIKSKCSRKTDNLPSEQTQQRQQEQRSNKQPNNSKPALPCSSTFIIIIIFLEHPPPKHSISFVAVCLLCTFESSDKHSFHPHPKLY